MESFIEEGGFSSVLARRRAEAERQRALAALVEGRRPPSDGEGDFADPTAPISDAPTSLMPPASAAGVPAPSPASARSQMAPAVAQMNPFMQLIDRANRGREAAAKSATSAPAGAALPQAISAPAAAPRVLRQSAAVPQQQSAGATGEVNPLSIEGRLARLYEEQKQLAAKPATPLYTPEEVAQRRANNERMMQLGIMGTASGLKNLQGIADPMLRAAMAEQMDRATEHGTMNPLTGEFKYLPGYQEARRAEAINKEMERLIAVQAKLESAQEIAADRNDTRREIAAMGRSIAGALGGKITPHGYSHEGNPVFIQNGQQIEMTEQGNRLYPYPVQSQTDLDKSVNSAMTFLGAEKRLNDIESLVKNNPRAFGGVTSLAALTPTVLSSRLMENLTPTEQEARARVLREMAAVVNQLYGAALSRGEEKLASGFIWSGPESAGTLIPKLHAARAYQRGQLEALGPGIIRTAARRAGVAPEAALRGTATSATPGAGAAWVAMPDGTRVRVKGGG